MLFSAPYNYLYEHKIPNDQKVPYHQPFKLLSKELKTYSGLIVPEFSKKWSYVLKKTSIMFGLLLLCIYSFFKSHNSHYITIESTV